MGKYRFPKINHKVNKIIRELNENLKQDSLWKGRFELRQISKKCYKFPDNSGYDFYWLYRVYDKKTGKAAQKWFNEYDIIRSWHLWEFVNNFIVKFSKVWEEIPKIDYNSPSYIDKPIPQITELFWM